MCNDDAVDWRARIGVLTPHFDLVPEYELCAMAPVGVSIHAGRVQFGVSAGAAVVGVDAVRAFAEPPYVDEATELLAEGPIDAIIYGFTSSSYLFGPDADAALRERLERRAGGAPVVIPCVAAVKALRLCEVSRLALVSPPWFLEETDALGAKYFQAQGIEVVYHAPAELEFGALPSGQVAIKPEQLYEWVRTRVPDKADAVYIGGNGFRAIGAIDSLEIALGRPVLTANQVALWQALEIVGIKNSVTKYGHLLEEGYSG
jgi:maleate isomerase